MQQNRAAGATGDLPPQRPATQRIGRSGYSVVVPVGSYWRVVFLFSLLMGFAPQIAWANAGTPLMWAGAFHLVIGNALIGLVEGAIIAFAFNAPRVRTVVLMIVANYVSAWFGYLFVFGQAAKLLQLDLMSAWHWLWALVGIAYVVTLILEWPFVALAFRGSKNAIVKSIGATFVVQTLSYAVLFGYYLSNVGISLYTEATVVTAAEMELPDSLSIYYIKPTDGDVYCRSLRGGDEWKVMDLNSSNLNDRLVVLAKEQNPDQWDLAARLESIGRRPEFVMVHEDIAGEVAPDWRQEEREPDGTWFNLGIAADLGDQSDSHWEFSSGFWALEGLTATNKETKDEIRLAFETPMAAWSVRNVVHLPGDKALFQLDVDQICVFDPETRQVALLWVGGGATPVIVADRSAIRKN